MHVDEIQSGIGPNLLVRNWPPAIPEWNTKAVRDAFFASPLFPRLLERGLSQRDHCARRVERAARLCRQDREREISAIQFQTDDHRV